MVNCRDLPDKGAAYNFNSVYNLNSSDSDFLCPKTDSLLIQADSVSDLSSYIEIAVSDCLLSVDECSQSVNSLQILSLTTSIDFEQNTPQSIVKYNRDTKNVLRLDRRLN